MNGEISGRVISNKTNAAARFEALGGCKHHKAIVENKMIASNSDSASLRDSKLWADDKTTKRLTKIK